MSELIGEQFKEHLASVDLACWCTKCQYCKTTRSSFLNLWFYRHVIVQIDVTSLSMNPKVYDITITCKIWQSKIFWGIYFRNCRLFVCFLFALFVKITCGFWFWKVKIAKSCHFWENSYLAIKRNQQNFIMLIVLINTFIPKLHSSII